MHSSGRILVFQTAFTGDVILTLPLIQVLHETLSHALIDVVVVPGAARLLAQHPAIHKVIEYDKKGEEKGFAAAYRLVRRLRQSRYETALIPHRSIRSALICFLAGIPRRIGFSTSAGSFLFTDVVPYEKQQHEVVRNISLAHSLGISARARHLPRLYPSRDDVRAVDELLGAHTVKGQNMVAIAPGSVWATKRWLPERYADVCERMEREGLIVVLIGGEADLRHGNEIESRMQGRSVINAMGKLTVLQSAELISRCKVAVTNDSSPMHLAVAMRTPVVAIFGATVPEFGFAPLGEYDEIVQTFGLECRPCAIHGGHVCPIGTFVCMTNIQVEHVIEKVRAVLTSSSTKVA